MRQNPSNSETNAPCNIVIPTAGEILDDGTIIDLVEDPSRPGALALVKFGGREPEIASQIEHHGRLYVPRFISSMVRRSLRLPSSCAPSGPTTELFDRLAAVFENFTDLSEHARKSVVSVLLASWIPELIPGACDSFFVGA